MFRLRVRSLCHLATSEFPFLTDYVINENIFKQGEAMLLPKVIVSETNMVPNWKKWYVSINLQWLNIILLCLAENVYHYYVGEKRITRA